MSTLYRDAFNEVIEQLLPRVHQMGIRILELEAGHVRASAPFDGNTNHLGTMYAGTLFALAEVLGGALIAPSFDLSEVYPVVKDLQIKFRRPARGDVTAACSLDAETIEQLRTEVQAKGKAQFVLTVEIIDTENELVVTTEGTYQLRRHGG